MYKIIYKTDSHDSHSNHEISLEELSEDQLAGIIICFYLNSRNNTIKIYGKDNVIVDIIPYIRKFLLKEINGIRKSSFDNMSREDIRCIAKRVPSPTIPFKIECSTYYPIVITSKYTILLHRDNDNCNGQVSLWVQFNDLGFLNGYIGALRWLSINTVNYSCLSFLDCDGKERYLTIK